jgi:hypothetical protein
MGDGPPLAQGSARPDPTRAARESPWRKGPPDAGPLGPGPLEMSRELVPLGGEDDHQALDPLHVEGGMHERGLGKRVQVRLHRLN